LAAVAALLLLSAAGAAASSHGPKHKYGRGTSTNWSGYAVDGANATHVIGTWTQPTATCGRKENSWSSPWVGIDGNNSNTVEQIGTDTDCSRGTPSYYAWYEMYPKSLVVIPMTVTPGHTYTGEVTYASGQYLMRLTDNSAPGATPFQTTQASKQEARSSVEWVIEGPSNGSLTNFGSVPFGAATATIDGQTGNLGSFSGAQQITMVSKSGASRAVPTAISGGTSFGVDWIRR